MRRDTTAKFSLIRGRPREASKLLPHVHRVASLLKRGLLGTHQGAVEPQHLAYYLDEFTFPLQSPKLQKSRQAVLSAHATGCRHRADYLRRHSRRVKTTIGKGTTGGGYLSQMDSPYRLIESSMG